ncbi:MAG TPA: bacteriohopanetetrol glucosamine biosynthesis glycosyltransferase HpnI [Terriglobia bacterium]|nr:bacteriohopanetetrol glucosamine biosynthesis glycosyltransferase HpnI [Terriglobia bacterium]
MLPHHPILLHDLREVVLFSPFLAFAYYVVASFCASRFFSRTRQTPADFIPPVSILKPVRGVDREAYENFASFCRLDYPAYEILFGVRRPGDPVIPIIQKLIRDFPERSIRLFVGFGEQGANEKASILACLAREARHDLLVASDSDTRVQPDCLRAIAAPFQNPETGAVTCLYRGEQESTLGDALEAIGVSSDFVAGVLVAWQFSGVHFALGATMAVTRQRLNAIGGFEALSDYLLDDYELGRRIAAQGYRVELLSYPVAMVLPSASFREYWQRQLRWSAGVRHSRPWGHFGLLVTQGLPISLLAMVASRSAREAGFYLSAYLASRYLMAWRVGIWGLGDGVLRRKWWLVPARDAIAFSTWAASIFYNRVTWRGGAFYLRKGRLVPQ